MTHIIHFIKKYKYLLAVGGILFLLWWFSIPKPLFDKPTTTVVESKEGLMLGARIATDGQWRFPEIEEVPEKFKHALLLFEDEYFYKHPGFNPVSITKAFFHNLRGRSRRGGSTLTQQVIRLAGNDKRRSYTTKLMEAIQATRLEATYSKESILKLYASHAPFGGNVVGLETASWRYYGLPSDALGWGQAAALAVLPNAPALIFPGKNEDLLKAKRDALLYKLYQKKYIDKTTYELALEEAIPGKPQPLPNSAPHLTERIRREHPGRQIKTTIDYHLQNKVNQLVREHYNRLKHQEIYNVALMVMDVNTKEILAYVGNAPTDVAHKNYVDIIRQPRSTGSILKPFLFAAALDAGELLPQTLVADVPTSINGYAPQNFDKKYYGAVPASTALSRSLNIPSVRMLQTYGLERFYNSLKKTNQPQINKPANYYGLSFILGGAESNLEHITNAYAGMAYTLNTFNSRSSEYPTSAFPHPVYQTPAQKEETKRQATPEIWNAGAIYHTFEALKEVNRPLGEEQWHYFSHSKPIAWKTGTSYGFKDAWAVGVTPHYAIGVWAGNATGEGRPGLTGILAAAPLLFDVLNSLPNSGWFSPPFDALTEVEICQKSGHIASAYCNEIKKEWIPEKGTRTAMCPYHHRVFLDAQENFQVNASCYERDKMQVKNWFSLPPLQAYFYAQQHPQYQALPPFASDCVHHTATAMAFIYPKQHEAVLLPKDFDEQINEVIFKVAHPIPNATVFWYLDSEYIGKTSTFHELSLSPTPGKYTLTAVDDQGHEIKQQIVIKHL